MLHFWVTRLRRPPGNKSRLMPAAAAGGGGDSAEKVLWSLFGEPTTELVRFNQSSRQCSGEQTRLIELYQRQYQ
jgi:hypothetical protein